MPGRPGGVAVTVPVQIDDKRIGGINKAFVPAVKRRPSLPDVIIARYLGD